MFKKPSILRAIGDASVPIGPMTTEPFGVDDLSTDLILDAPFMAKASALLGSNDLIAVIPKRGWLTVGRCQPGEIPVMDRFAKTAAGIASRAGRSALTTNCYFMQNGVVHGITDGSYVSLLTNQTYRWNLG